MKRIQLFIAGLALLSTAPTFAEDYSEDFTVLTLARQCVAEIDFVSTDECWLMWHVNAKLADVRSKREPGWHLVDQLRAYNSGFKVSTPRTLWVMGLNLDGAQPEHWPSKVEWSRYRGRWLEIIERARDFLEDPGEHPCPVANAYGGDCYRNPYGACDQAPWCWVQVMCHRPGQRPYVQAYYAARRCVVTGDPVP